MANPTPTANSLNVGYRFQRYWDNSMAYAFFCAELYGLAYPYLQDRGIRADPEHESNQSGTLTSGGRLS